MKRMILILGYEKNDSHSFHLLFTFFSSQALVLLWLPGYLEFVRILVMKKSLNARGNFFLDLLTCAGVILVLSSFSQIFSPVKTGDSLWSQDSLEFELLLKFSAGVALVVTSLSVANTPSGSPSSPEESSQFPKIMYSTSRFPKTKAKQLKDLAS